LAKYNSFIQLFWSLPLKQPILNVRPMVKSNINETLAGALHRGKDNLFMAMKTNLLISHLYFLKECKRRNVIPSGLVIADKLATTFSSAASRSLALSQSRQWLTLTIKETYKRLHYRQQTKCHPLSKEDSHLLSSFTNNVSQLKKRKLHKLLNVPNSIPEANNSLLIDTPPTSTASQTTAATPTNSSISPFSNLSSHNFSEEELCVLQQGPSFVPPLEVSKMKKKADYIIEGSINSIKRQYFYKLAQQTPQNGEQQHEILHEEEDNLIRNNTWKFKDPTKRIHGHAPTLPDAVELAMNSLEQRVKAVTTKAMAKGGQQEKSLLRTIKSLRKVDSVVILPSDKTKRLVAMDVTHYQDLHAEHLNNYKQIHKISLPKTRQDKFNKALKEISNKYTGQTRELLLHGNCSEPLPSQMTLLPKDHKSPLKGRPLVAALDTPSTALAKVLSFCLKPVLSHLSTHLSSTKNFVQCLTNYNSNQGHNVNHHVYFGSLDVTNLYGSIPLSGPQNLFNVLESFFSDFCHLSRISDLHPSDFRKLLELTLTSDIILLNGKFYRQMSGVPMGGNLSPILAIIYVSIIEQSFINNSNIYFYKRYIDDCFIISSKPVQTICDEANKVNSNIQFTVELPSNEQIAFLDTYVTQSSSGQFSTELYSKPMSSNHILPWNSFVPFSRKRALLIAERKRAERNSTTLHGKQRSLEKIAGKFRANNYPEGVIQK